jgi:UDP-N-acetyl-D-mannosaminouronate:lipid I N-acetyl-D-mannosaminouronosyltransferase
MENLSMNNKSFVNGIKINSFISKNQFLDYINDKKNILVAINAEKILKEDKKLKNIINENIGYPDGVGAVMALKQKGLNATKIPGSEFWLDIINRYQNEKSFYLIGTTTEVIENTVKKLKQEYPNINILGYQNGFINEEQKVELKEKLKKLKPDVVYVAQGTPRQEFLMDELIKIHPALYMGLGGSFDIYGGNKKRAPKIFLDLHCEWLYRLIKEPTRIGRQISLVKFLILLKLGKL